MIYLKDITNIDKIICDLVDKKLNVCCKAQESAEYIIKKLYQRMFNSANNPRPWYIV